MKNNNKKKKNSKKELLKNTELRVFSIGIKNDKLEKELKYILFTYRHFENMLLILISQNYELCKKNKDILDPSSNVN
jgi:hypothetical protein